MFFLVVWVVSFLVLLGLLPVLMVKWKEAVKKDEEKDLDKVAVLDYEKIRFEGLPIDDICAGFLVMGGAGSWKTSGVLLRLLKLFMAKRMNLLIYDHKGEVGMGGEIMRYVFGLLRLPAFARIGYELTLIDPANPQLSGKINILNKDYYSDETEIRAVFSTLMDNFLGEAKDPTERFFRTCSIGVMTALTMYLNEKSPKDCNLINVCLMTAFLSVDELKVKLEGSPRYYIQAAALFESIASERQFAAIRSNNSNFLSFILNPRVVNIFYDEKGNYFDYGRLNNSSKPQIFILSNLFKNQSEYSPLISAIIMNTIRNIAVNGRQPTQLIMEEGAQLNIPKFSTIPATLRGYGIGTTYITQDDSVAEEVMKREAWRATKSNLSYQFYGKLNEPKTAKEVIDGMPKIEKKKFTYQLNDFLKGSVTKVKENFLEPNDLISLRKGAFWCFIGGKVKKINFKNMDAFALKKSPPLDFLRKEVDIEAQYNKLLTPENLSRLKAL